MYYLLIPPYLGFEINGRVWAGVGSEAEASSGRLDLKNQPKRKNNKTTNNKQQNQREEYQFGDYVLYETEGLLLPSPKSYRTSL